MVRQEGEESEDAVVAGGIVAATRQQTTKLKMSSSRFTGYSTASVVAAVAGQQHQHEVSRQKGAWQQGVVGGATVPFLNTTRM